MGLDDNYKRAVIRFVNIECPELVKAMKELTRELASK